jgi:hypothetical protein
MKCSLSDTEGLSAQREGHEQEFNSLHAQREACEAFIKSQAGRGLASNQNSLR